MSFDRDFSVMVTPEGQRVPLMHYQNLILIDIELNEGEPETATPEPAPSLPDSATPRVSRGLAVGSFLAAALAFVAVSLDAVIEPIRGLRQRECFEASFAGCGAMADAFRADSGVVAGMLERDPAKLPLLRAAHRHAQFHLDYEDTSSGVSSDDGCRGSAATSRATLRAARARTRARIRSTRGHAA